MLLTNPGRCQLREEASKPCLKVADIVAKVPKGVAANFPLKDEPSDDRRSMYPQARQRSCQ
jgi:hypothetical protein